MEKEIKWLHKVKLIVNGDYLAPILKKYNLTIKDFSNIVTEYRKAEEENKK